jgi:hypothetical protein
LTKLNTFHMALFAHFLEKLRSTADGEGSLLDRAMIVYGSGMSNSDMHLHSDVPMLLVGGGSGHIKGGRHVRAENGTAMTNLYVSVLDNLGMPTERFGDSTGKLAGL